MPRYYNAFVPGESVEITAERHLVAALKNYRNGGEILQRLRQHVGQRFRILGCSFPHGSGVLYDLQGIEGSVWEECLLDWAICKDDEGYMPASEMYHVNIAEENGIWFVQIADKLGREFCKMRRASKAGAQSHAAAINEMAAVRCRCAFEGRFGFDGIYEHTN